MTVPTEAEIWAKLRALPLEGFATKVPPPSAAPLKALQSRAQAELTSYQPITPEERFKGFARLGFHPHGLYWPDDLAARAAVKEKLDAAGALEETDARHAAYLALQAETADFETAGIPGKWSGQQAVARSTAKFRLVEWGRQSGKTMYSAHEVLGIALQRPRAHIWAAAPTMLHVSRVWGYIVNLLRDHGIKCSTLRDSAQEKYLELEENETIIEGVTLEKPTASAGDTIIFALVDEAALISEDAWYVSILPPLSARDGSALLASSPYGGTGFFAEKVVEAKKEVREKGGESAWDFFHAASWEVNFYRFPQGRQSRFLKNAEREMPWRDFLMSFGAIPLSDQDRIFPEFKDRIHVGDYLYDPDLPVRLAVDPSGGANPYAVAAIQDYDDYIVIFDEIYETHVTAEQVIAQIRQKPWAGNIECAILDSAAGPAEIARWNGLGIRAFSLRNKPEINMRLPFVRNLLRDPMRFSILHRRKVNDQLAEWGLEPDTDHELDEDQQKTLAIQVEQSLTDEYITPEDMQALSDCARLYVSKNCAWTIWEFHNYRGQKRVKVDMNFGPNPRDHANHIMDALGYYAWQWHRTPLAAGGQISTILPTDGPLPEIPRPQEGVAEPVLLSDYQLRNRMTLIDLRRRRPTVAFGPVFGLLPCR